MRTCAKRSPTDGVGNSERSAGHRKSVPDPQAVATFKRSILNWGEVHEGAHARMLDWYRQLIELRRVRLLERDAESMKTDAWYDSERTLLGYTQADLLVCCNFGDIAVRVPEAMGATLLLASDDAVCPDETPALNPNLGGHLEQLRDVDVGLGDVRRRPYRKRQEE